MLIPYLGHGRKIPREDRRYETRQQKRVALDANIHHCPCAYDTTTGWGYFKLADRLLLSELTRSYPTPSRALNRW
jgi:hypothetical protein